MTNPGYECDRKRKRDIFALHKIFGGIGIPMANISGLGLLSPERNVSLLQNQDPVYANSGSSRGQGGSMMEQTYNSGVKNAHNVTNSTNNPESSQGQPSGFLIGNSLLNLGQSNAQTGAVAPNF
jgi:hypothetical protein